MRERPISVMVFGILNIGWAMLGLIFFAISGLLKAHSATNPFTQQMNNNALYATWIKIVTPIGVAFTVALLAAGIGLLLLQNWARILSIIYGIYAIITGILGGIVMVIVFSSVSLPNSPNMPPFMRTAIMVGTVFGMVLGMIYPVLLIIFMIRPKVIAAFKPELLLT